jgi:segregation and condensation protein A
VKGRGHGVSEAEFESLLERYPIRLSSFEGPLDLLLHLIKQNQIDIYDIPIVAITEQYLEYLDLMQELDLDVAAEFLVMAATLIHIKSRMLLPRPQPGDSEDDEDPRDGLVRRLLEHQKFRAAAELLHERQLLRSAQWPRPASRVADLADDTGPAALEVDLFSLLTAFRNVLERARRRPAVPLPAAEVPIEVRIADLLARLSEREACGFEDLFDDAVSRADLITTFLALLEMIRLGLVRVFQMGPFGPIRVYKRPPRVGPPEGRSAQEES